MKKLSEDLQDLADHVAQKEKEAEAAEQASKAKVEASLQKSKAEAKARQESFKADVKKKQAATAMHWQELQDNYNKKVQQIKQNITTEKEAHEVKQARHRADDAESYAEAAIDFAMMAVDEAEVAVLEAIEANAYADTLA
jgi:hypothetical protein